MEVVLELMLLKCAMPSVSRCHASTKYSKLYPILRCHPKSHGTSSASVLFLVSASLRVSHNLTLVMTPLLTLTVKSSKQLQTHIRCRLDWVVTKTASCCCLHSVLHPVLPSRLSHTCRVCCLVYRSCQHCRSNIVPS